MKFSILIFVTLLAISSSKIKILSPNELSVQFDHKEINASLSNFGKINYGYTMVGKLHWDSKNIFNDYACGNISNFTHPPSNITEVDSSPIIMVDRGQCTFVTKVRNIEKLGGKIALIIDNKENENVNSVIMSDDGTGRDLTIPGLLISYKDGQKLKEYYLKNQDENGVYNEITLRINYEIARQKTVEFQVYFSSEITEIYYFLIHINEFISKLKESVVFTPYYISDSHPLFNSKNRVEYKNCISGGEYCVTSLDSNLQEPRAILLENIRQKCIFKHENAKYFDYIKEFYKKCLKSAPVKFNKSCAVDAMDNVKIDSDIINNCLSSSFQDYSHYAISPNKLLEEDQNQRRNIGAYLIPYSIVINDRQFRGNLKIANVMEAICAGYIKRPALCSEEGFYEESGLSWGMIIFIIIVVLGLNIFIYMMCRRYISKKIMERLETTDINHRINTVVTSYLSLKDTK